MLIRFTKMHGLGNDFVMLDQVSQDIKLSPEQIKALADRHRGIGFDQLLMVEPPQDPEMDFFYRAFNADGSEAEQCGNGARCFLRFVRDRGLTTKTCIKVQTRNSKIECQLEKDGTITVNMGKPNLDPQRIPFLTDFPALTYKISVESSPVCKDKKVIEISAVSMGNPHAVVQVEDVDKVPVEILGPMIENHEKFPKRVNAGFVEIVNRNKIRLRVWERGAGETLACGTGACAAVVSQRLLGLLDDEVEVEFKGGIAKVCWKGNDAPVYLTGPVCRVYEGRTQI